jgi:6-phosphogluconolactonase (cycloisomerase 2 family)
MAIKINSEVVLDRDSNAKIEVGQTTDSSINFKAPLNEAFDVTTAVLNGKSKYLGYVGGTPSALTFHPDGTRLFTIGETSDSFNEYTLSTAWDISTAVFKKRSLIGTWAATVRGMYFRPDGHAAYVYDGTTRTVQQWDLDTAWEVASASYTRYKSNTFKRFNGSLVTIGGGAGDGTPSAITLKPDGTKLYWHGLTDVTRVMTLTTPFDINTAVYTGSTTNIATAVGTVNDIVVTNHYGMSFNATGTKIFYVDYYGTMSEFTVTTPWAPESGIVFVRTITIGNKDGGYYRGLTFNANGTRFFVAGDANDNIIEYSMSSAYSTAGTVQQVNVYRIGDFATAPTAFEFNGDGTKFIVAGSTQDRIFVFNLSTPYDLSTRTYFEEIYIALQEPTIQGLHWDNDDSSIYFLGSTTDSIWQIDLPERGILSSVLEHTVHTRRTSSNHAGLDFKPDGTSFFIVNYNGGSVEEWKMTTAWDLTTAYYSNSFGTIDQSTPQGIWMRGDGYRFFTNGTSGDDVSSYRMTTPWDLTTAQYEGRIAIPDTAPRMLTFKPDGTKMYAGGITGDSIYEYDLTGNDLVIDGGASVGGSLLVAGDVTVANQLNVTGRVVASTVEAEYFEVDNRLSFGANGVINPSMGADNVIDEYNDQHSVKIIEGDISAPNDVWITEEGTRMYMVGNATDRIVQYTLSTPHDLATATLVGFQEMKALCGASYPTSIWVKSDGTQLWLIDRDIDAVIKLTFGTAWDVTTLAYSGINPNYSLNVSAGDGNPSEITFKPDGTRFYIAGDATNRITQYNCSTAWRVSTGVDTGFFDMDVVKVTFPGSIIGIEGVAFSADGTKMFVSDNTSDAVFRFELSVAWDVTTASYNRSAFVESADIGGSPDDLWVKADGKQFWVVDGNIINKYVTTTAYNVAQITSTPSQTFTVNNPSGTGIHLSPDGTKLFVTDTTLESVIKYTMSPGFDLSTLSHYAGAPTTYDISGQATNAGGMTLANGGTRMYVAGTDANAVFEYTLSTPYQISSGVTYSRSFDTSAVTSGNMSDVSISTDGTKMFICTPTAVYGYTLSTAYNITTATLVTTTVVADAFDVNGRLGITNITDMKFSPDGMNFYLTGTGGDRVFQYKLSTAWDLSPSSVYYQGDSLALDDTAPQAMSISQDGRYLYFIGSTYDRVFSYTMSVPFMIGSATLASQRWLGGTVTNPKGIYLVPDGSKFFVCGSTSDLIVEYDMTTNFEVESLDIGDVLVFDKYETGFQSLHLKDDGTRLYVIGTTTDAISQYDLTTAWDIKSARKSLLQSGMSSDTAIQAFTLSSNGQYIYYWESTNRFIQRYTLTTPYDILAVTSRQAIPASMFASTGPGLAISANGSYVFALDSSTDTIQRITLSTPYDLSTAQLGQTFYTPEGSSPGNIVFNTNGTRMFVVDNAGDEVNQYNLSTAYDLTTAVYNNRISLGGPSIPSSLRFNNTGTKLYVAGQDSASLYQYTLSTAFQIETATLDADRRIYLGALVGNLRGFDIKSTTGTEIYLVGDVNDTVYQYTLPTAWNVLSISNGNVLFVEDNESTPTGLFVGNSGTKLYITGESADDVWQYDMSSAYNITTATYNAKKYVTVYRGLETGVRFNSTGTKMFVYERTRAVLLQHILSTPWDVTTATLDYAFSTLYLARAYFVTPTYSGVSGFSFSTNGDYLYLASDYEDIVKNIKLSIPFDLRSISVKTFMFNNGTGFDDPFGMNVSPDGTRLTTINYDTDSFDQWIMTTPYDLSTIVSTSYTRKSVSPMTAPIGFTFSTDGSMMFALGNATDRIYSYTLTGDPFDISNIVSAGYIDVLSSIGITTPSGIVFKYDGTKMFINDDWTSRVVEFNLSTAWDITTATVGNSFSTAADDTTMRQFVFTSDGSYMFVIGDQYDRMLTYRFSVPWDITTGTLYNTRTLPLYSTLSVMLNFSACGRYLYVGDRNTDSINRLTISDSILSFEGQTAFQGLAHFGGNVVTTADVDSYGYNNIRRGEINGYIPNESNMQGNNLLINGGFTVSQRGTFTSPTNISELYYVDRFKLTTTPANNWNFQHNLDTSLPDGSVTNSISVTCTGSGYAAIPQFIEDFKWLANKPVTFSLWAKTNISNAYATHYFGVSQPFAMSFIGDGQWHYYTGTTIVPASPTTMRPEVWTNVGCTTGDYLEIAKVQYEVGTRASAFEHRSYGEELALCQRYFQTIGGNTTNETFAAGFTAGNNFFGHGKLNGTMRASPTASVDGTLSHIGYTHTSIAVNASAIGFTTHPNGFHVNIASSSSTTINAGAYARSTNTATRLFFSAEL